MNNTEDVNCRRAIFLTAVDPATYALLCNLLSLMALTTKMLSEIISALNLHFDLAVLVIEERCILDSYVRWAGESVANFIAKLCSLIKHCNCGTLLGKMFHNRIMTSKIGIQVERIQRKLLPKSQLTLTRATEIVVIMEMATRNARNLQMPSSSEVNISQSV